VNSCTMLLENESGETTLVKVPVRVPQAACA